MVLKVNIEKIKARLEQQKEKASGFDPKNSIILKATEEGQLNFRAVIYPHTEDPSAEPFLERYYHWGIPGAKGPVYCPKKNRGEDCKLCDFVWERVVENKGTDAVKQWTSKLPRLSVMVVGLVRGREEEGPKFFRISSQEKEPSKNHAALYGWLLKSATENWLDPERGFDLELIYKKPDEKQSRYLKGAKLILHDMDLARGEPTKFGTKKEYEEFVNSIPNVDKDVYPEKTSEDILGVLKEWQKKMGPTEETVEELNEDDGIEVSSKSEKSKSRKAKEENSDDETSESPSVVVDEEDFNSKLKALGI